MEIVVFVFEFAQHLVTSKVIIAMITMVKKHIKIVA